MQMSRPTVAARDHGNDVLVWMARPEIYLGATDTFMSLAPLPEARGWAVSLRLSDGSVMFVGPHGSAPWRGCTDPERFATAIRYVPGS